VTGLVHLTAATAVLATAVIYGFDVFAALVLRPALEQVDDRSLTSVMGHIHAYGDRRLAVPSALSLLLAAATTVVALVAGRGGAAAAAGLATVALAGWLAIYGRVSAPINRQLTSAALAGRTAPDAHGLQRRWNGVIGARTALQALALAGLCVALVL
jgi:hypothetical protein